MPFPFLALVESKTIASIDPWPVKEEVFLEYIVKEVIKNGYEKDLLPIDNTIAITNNISITFCVVSIFTLFY